MNDSKQEAFEVAVSVHSVTNARHTCGARLRPTQPPVEDYCSYCGERFDKAVMLRVSIRLPNTSDLKGFLVSDLAGKVKRLAEEGITDYLDREDA